ncbi:MAG TPA: GNAT family N-acetyltransferase [Methanocella sp.]|uniref:GNAT family N-acetyltransferase n=1 Tax=Methanocella sp. TaxID=2052833 RepID=UPI002CC1F266|nr:GNAT family N-acetyltransferase [Methanocella sp.]HTY90705.1 GNAT family N-acetyltransferase [Methanocella sp.]
MSEQRIRTAHMELIPGTPEILKAEMEGSEALAAALEAKVIEGWPPEIWKDAVEEFLIRLERHPGLTGWLNWYWILVEDDTRTLIGSGGFTGAPFNGQLMIGYSVLDRYQHQGYGTEAVNALVNWAFSKPGVQLIVAETHAGNKGSIRLLEKCGFEYRGKGFENGTIRYAIPREKWLLAKK